MRSLKVLLTVGLVLLLISTAMPAMAQGAPVRRIVVFDATAPTEGAREALVRRLGGDTLKHLPLVNGMVVLLPPEAAVALARAPGVLRVEEDPLVYALALPVNRINPRPVPAPQPPESLPWGVNRIDADLAWAASRGAGIKVAVIDTGIALNHLDLKANIKGGYNAISPLRSYNDDNGHGTHVAGTIAAVDNEIGVIGVAPQAHLYAVKVLNSSGVGYVSDVIVGLDWCIQNKMQVINMSLGGGGTTSYHSAIKRAHGAGIVIVAAAGNDGMENSVNYPAKYDETIAVSATDGNNTLASWSSRGPEVDLAAPGVAILSTWNNGYYREGSGTSMATPHVAGTVALVLAMWGATTPSPAIPEEVRMLLHRTADDLNEDGFDNWYGWGLVDAEEAVTGNQTLP
jgi:subtilisin family serine protease